MAHKVKPTITVKHLGDEKALVKYYYLLLCMAAKEKRATAKEDLNTSYVSVKGSK